MQRNIYILLFTLLIIPLINYGQEKDSILLKGNDFYISGNYEEAINTYQKIIDSGFVSSELYFNLGNAYYKQKKIAFSILYYEKAKQLAPNNEDIRYNLNLANKLVVDKIEKIPELIIKKWIRNYTNLFSSDLWAIISITCFIFMLLVILIYLFTLNIAIKKFTFWIAIIMFSVTATSYIISYKHKKEITTQNTAIIFSPSLTVKSSPDNSGTDLFLVHEGTKVNVEDRIGNWIEIKLDDGNKGWIEIENLKFI